MNEFLMRAMQQLMQQYQQQQGRPLGRDPRIPAPTGDPRFFGGWQRQANKMQYADRNPEVSEAMRQMMRNDPSRLAYQPQPQQQVSDRPLGRDPRIPTPTGPAPANKMRKGWG